MRRSPALLVVTVALAGGLGGCQRYAGNPLRGFGPFIAQTNTTSRADAKPPGGDETMLHAQGYSSPDVGPLLPEPGNVWPGPVPPEKSLSDIERQQNEEQSKIDQANPTPPQPSFRRPARGSSTPPGAVRTAPSPPPRDGSPGVTAPQILTAPSPLIGKNGPLIPDRGNGSGIDTATTPGQAGQSILVPNGNGTTTVIGPDGSTQVVPTPR